MTLYIGYKKKINVLRKKVTKFITWLYIKIPHNGLSDV